MIGFNTFTLAVVGKAADLWGVDAHEITKVQRNRRIAWPRMAAAWAIRECDPGPSAERPVYSFKRLCRVFPWTDHTTAIHAVHKAKKLRETDPEFLAKSNELLDFAKRIRMTGKVMVGGHDGQQG